MIHYQLRCVGDHAFDGWFKDSAGFDRQASAGLVECPECGATQVHRALMAPRIASRRQTVDPAGAPAAETVPAPAAPSAPPALKEGAALPDQVRGMLQKLRAEVERTCENVGNRFAEEARAIHHGETEPRAIYGDTTPEQAEALADDGIPVSRIPWVPRADG